MEQKIDESLQKAAENHATERFRITRNEFLAEKCKWSFIAGAQWYLNSLWHDSSKEQPKELETVIYNSRKWCYLSDILSMTKD